MHNHHDLSDWMFLRKIDQMHDGGLSHELNGIVLLFAWDLNYKRRNGRCFEAGETPVNAIDLVLNIREK